MRHPLTYSKISNASFCGTGTEINKKNYKQLKQLKYDPSFLNCCPFRRGGPQKRMEKENRWRERENLYACANWYFDLKDKVIICIGHFKQAVPLWHSGSLKGDPTASRSHYQWKGLGDKICSTWHSMGHI